MNKIVKYVIIVIIVILLAIGAIGLFKKSGGTDTPPAEGDSTKTKIIKHKHYEYEIPENWDFSQEDLYFDLTNPSEKGWSARIALIYDADEYLLGRYGLITKDLREKGYNFEEPITKETDGIEYVIYRTTLAMDTGEIESRLIGYFHSERQYAYSINIISKKEEYDYDVLYKISKILLKGKFDNTDTTYYYYTYEYDEKE